MAESLSLSVDFSSLRKSIDKVQAASLKLDSEKAIAEKNFRDLLDKLPKGTGDKGILGWIKWLVHRPKFPYREWLKAMKRVQKANDKLVAFEKGFISQEGIKDREWYRHLGVAPGKWLGQSNRTTCLHAETMLTFRCRIWSYHSAVSVRRVGVGQERDRGKHRSRTRLEGVGRSV